MNEMLPIAKEEIVGKPFQHLVRTFLAEVDGEQRANVVSSPL